MAACTVCALLCSIAEEISPIEVHLTIAWSGVCRLSHSRTLHAKVVSRNEMPFGRDTLVVPGNIVLNRDPSPPTGKKDLGVGTPSSQRCMSPIAKLLRPLLFFCTINQVAAVLCTGIYVGGMFDWQSVSMSPFADEDKNTSINIYQQMCSGKLSFTTQLQFFTDTRKLKSYSENSQTVKICGLEHVQCAPFFTTPFRPLWIKVSMPEACLQSGIAAG